jgi:hypothetical protein
MVNQDLHFLQEKIQDLKNALFISQNSSLLRIPTTIISIVKTDDLGQVWFFVSRPKQFLHEFDREFPAKLEFFRKGKRFFLHITGKAFIVSDPEEINSLVGEEMMHQATEHVVLIKFKMQKADYFESAVPGERSGIKWWKSLLRPYHLERPMSMFSFKPVV